MSTLNHHIVSNTDIAAAKKILCWWRSESTRHLASLFLTQAITLHDIQKPSVSVYQATKKSLSECHIYGKMILRICRLLSLNKSEQKIILNPSIIYKMWTGYASVYGRFIDQNEKELATKTFSLLTVFYNICEDLAGHNDEKKFFSWTDIQTKYYTRFCAHYEDWKTLSTVIQANRYKLFNLVVQTYLSHFLLDEVRFLTAADFDKQVAFYYTSSIIPYRNALLQLGSRFEIQAYNEKRKNSLAETEYYIFSQEQFRLKSKQAVDKKDLFKLFTIPDKSIHTSHSYNEFEREYELMMDKCYHYASTDHLHPQFITLDRTKRTAAWESLRKTMLMVEPSYIFFTSHIMDICFRVQTLAYKISKTFPRRAMDTMLMSFTSQHCSQKTINENFNKDGVTLDNVEKALEGLVKVILRMNTTINEDQGANMCLLRSWGYSQQHFVHCHRNKATREKTVDTFISALKTVHNFYYDCNQSYQLWLLREKCKNSGGVPSQEVQDHLGKIVAADADRMDHVKTWLRDHVFNYIKEQEESATIFDASESSQQIQMSIVGNAILHLLNGDLPKKDYDDNVNVPHFDIHFCNFAS